MIRPVALAQLFALFLLLLTASGPHIRDARADTREAMAEAMVRMMEAMGLFDPAAMGSMPMGAPFGAGGWPGGLGTPGMAPWGMPMQDPAQTMERGAEMMKQYADGMPMPEGMGSRVLPWSSGSRLEGVWEGRNGELLIVQGNRFRIYPGSAGYVDGFLKLSGDRLALYNSKDANIRPFEYAESEGRLVLRDQAGGLLLYRRLWLDEQRAPATSTDPEK
jgi:hypothetical protein